METLKNAAFTAPVSPGDKVDIFIWEPLELSVTHEVVETDSLYYPTC